MMKGYFVIGFLFYIVDSVLLELKNEFLDQIQIAFVHVKYDYLYYSFTGIYLAFLFIGIILMIIPFMIVEEKKDDLRGKT